MAPRFFGKAGNWNRHGNYIDQRSGANARLATHTLAADPLGGRGPSGSSRQKLHYQPEDKQTESSAPPVLVEELQPSSRKSELQCDSRWRSNNNETQNTGGLWAGPAPQKDVGNKAPQGVPEAFVNLKSYWRGSVDLLIMSKLCF